MCRRFRRTIPARKRSSSSFSSGSSCFTDTSSHLSFAVLLLFMKPKLPSSLSFVYLLCPLSDLLSSCIRLDAVSPPRASRPPAISSPSSRSPQMALPSNANSPLRHRTPALGVEPVPFVPPYQRARAAGPVSVGNPALGAIPSAADPTPALPGTSLATMPSRAARLAPLRHKEVVTVSPLVGAHSLVGSGTTPTRSTASIAAARSPSRRPDVLTMMALRNDQPRPPSVGEVSLSPFVFNCGVANSSYWLALNVVPTANSVFLDFSLSLQSRSSFGPSLSRRRLPGEQEWM